MGYIPKTKNGHSMWDMASMLQKAIRRCDFERAGYAAYELFGGYHAMLWKRLVVISAEDCYGIMTKEIIALKLADDMTNKNKKGYDRDPLFVAKAITLLCMARKNRDGCYVACNFMIPDAVMDEDAIEHIDITKCKLGDEGIPDWVFDVHTLIGKRAGKTDWQMNIDEQNALKPRQVSLFDEGSWAPRYDFKHRHGLCTEGEYRASLEYRKGRQANPVEPIPDIEEQISREETIISEISEFLYNNGFRSAADFIQCRYFPSEH